MLLRLDWRLALLTALMVLPLFFASGACARSKLQGVRVAPQPAPSSSAS
jgi:hypothetical protein